MSSRAFQAEIVGNQIQCGGFAASSVTELCRAVGLHMIGEVYAAADPAQEFGDCCALCE